MINELATLVERLAGLVGDQNKQIGALVEVVSRQTVITKLLHDRVTELEEKV